MVSALLERFLRSHRHIPTTILPCRYTGFFIEMALEVVS